MGEEEKTSNTPGNIVPRVSGGTFYLAPNVANILKLNRKLTEYKKLIKAAGYTRIENRAKINSVDVPLPVLKKGGGDMNIPQTQGRELPNQISTPINKIPQTEEIKIGDTKIKIMRREPVPILKEEEKTPGELKKLTSLVDVYITPDQATKLRKSKKYKKFVEENLANGKRIVIREPTDNNTENQIMEEPPILQKEKETAPPDVDINEGALRNPKEWRNKALVPDKEIQIFQKEEIKDLGKDKVVNQIDEKLNTPSKILPDVNIKDLLAGANATEMINNRQDPNEIPTGKEIVGARFDENELNDISLPLTRELPSSFDIFTLLNNDIVTNTARFPSPQYPIDKLISFSRLFQDKIIKNAEKQQKFNEGSPISKRIFPKSNDADRSIYILARKEFVKVCVLYCFLKKFNVSNAEQISTYNNRCVNLL